MTDDRIRTRSDLRAFLRADLAVNGLTQWRPWYRYRKPTVVFLRALRRAEFLSLPTSNPLTRVRGSLARISLTRHSLRTGLSIPIGSFGRGLCIPHYGSIVVNSKARFGSYCCIQNSVNIGWGPDGIPTGGDFIYIAPGAVISGGVVIGSEAVIGANAVVRTSVPDATTYAGAPARQVSAKGSLGVMPTSIRTIMEAESREHTR